MKYLTRSTCYIRSGYLSLQDHISFQNYVSFQDIRRFKTTRPYFSLQEHISFQNYVSTATLGGDVAVEVLEQDPQEGLVGGELGVRRFSDVIVHVKNTLPVGLQAGRGGREGSVQVGVQLLYHLLTHDGLKLASYEVVPRRSLQQQGCIMTTWTHSMQVSITLYQTVSH